MAQRVLSISLGSEVIKVCEVLLAGKKKVHIFNAIDLVIPEGICDDGVILDVETLANVITEGLDGEGFTAKKVVFSISSRRIASKEAIIPFCKEKQIADIIRINASEYFPISKMDEYVIDYSILEVTQADNMKNYRLSVIATPRDVISGYYELARLLKMPVQSIDYAGNSILQVLKLQTANNEVDAVLQMGSENTVINIMDGPTLVMQRSVPYGRTAIVEAVKAYKGVPESVADMIVTNEYIGNLAENSEEVAEAVRSLLSSINRIIEFYSSRNQDKPIEHIYMIGDVLSINGLTDLFNQEWDHEVALIDSLHGVEVKNHEVLSDEIASNYLANIGALLAPMNIALPEEKDAKKKAQGLPWWLLILSGTLAIAMIAGVLIVYYIKDKDNKDLKRRIESYGDVESVEQLYYDTLAREEVFNNWYDHTKSANESIAKLINDLEGVQPPGISITQLTSKEDGFTINGTADAKASIAEFVIQLKKLEYVTDVKTESINETIEDLCINDAFTIQLTLHYDDPYKENTSDADDATGNSSVDSEAGDELDESSIVVEDTTGDNERVHVVEEEAN